MAVRALAPVLAVALVGLAVLLVAPATADMAAHTYRAGFFAREGWAVWNAQWYGGHHVLGYSVLFPPAAWLLGPRLVGALAGIAAVVLFAPLARRSPGAVWLFASAVTANVVIGRMPFTLGIAVAVGAWLAAERRRLALAGLLALAAVLASPVAGALLALAAVARGRRGLVLVLPALAGGAALALAFPEGGPDRFVATAFWPFLAVTLVATALLDLRGSRALAVGAALNVAMIVGAFVVPTTFGQNALRLGVLLGPPLLLLAPRPGAPRVLIAGAAAALVYLAWLPAIRAVAEARGDPATAPAFHSEVREIVGPRIRPGERIEVPLTRNHWEAAHLAPALPLARGWQRQLDAKANPLFYSGAPLTARRYEAWLRERAITWVALPAAPLDYSARAERALLERAPAFLEPVHRSRRWRIWRVRGARSPGLAGLHPDGFDLDPRRPGTVVARERYTRYWRVTRGDACVRRAGAFTAVEVRSPGRVEVRARLAPGREGRCG